MKTAVLALIGFYRSSLSPAIPSSCRFYPTCSGYAYEAVSEWGVQHGLWLAVRRILRCRPFGGYGLDPVPGRQEAPGAQNLRTE
jgi:putative membrane protein insertion efficiency factor